MAEKQTILKLNEEGKSIRAIAQTLGIATTTIWNVLKKKKTTGVLSNKHRTGRPRVTTAIDDRNIVRAVKKNPKTTVTDITANLHRAGVKVSQIEEDFERRNIEAIPQDANHSSAKRIGKPDWILLRSTEMSHKSFGTKFYGLMRPRLTSTKVMERPKYGERKDLLMIQKIQAHL